MMHQLYNGRDDYWSQGFFKDFFFFFFFWGGDNPPCITRDSSAYSMLPKEEGTVIRQRGSMSDCYVRSANKLYCRN